MRLSIKIIVTGLFLAFALPGALLAQTLEGAMNKYNSGDFSGALKDWQALADDGDVDALFNLGQMYRLGQGISFDFPRAEAYYSQAAAAGHTAAQRELGNLYFFSIGTADARNRAVPLWLEAAANGDAKAQYILGILYFNGDVVSKDKVAGYAWTLLAIDGGVPEALQSNTAMQGQLTDAELAASVALAPKQMTGTPKQGLYSYLIGEPFPRPRTLINGIKTTEAVPEPSEPSEDVLEEDLPALELPESVKIQEAEKLPPLREKPVFETGGAIEDAEAPTLDTDPTETEVFDPEPQPDPIEVVAEAQEGPPALGPEDSYDLGAPDSPLVDAEGFDGAWSIQLTSFRKPENAEAHWQEVLASYPDLFDLVARKILRFDLGSDLGVYYRLRIGPFLDKAEAEAKCQDIKNAGLDCLVIWP